MSEILKPGSEKWDTAWHGFAPGTWQSRVNVREFIQRNYTPYEGDGAFLQGATERTKGMWQTLQPLLGRAGDLGDTPRRGRSLLEGCQLLSQRSIAWPPFYQPPVNLASLPHETLLEIHLRHGLGDHRFRLDPIHRLDSLPSLNSTIMGTPVTR